MKKSNVIKENLVKDIVNNQNGVSLIMLAIAIMMMLIIVSFAVFNSQNTTPEAKVAASLSSLASVKDACENALGLIELNPKDYDDFYDRCKSRTVTSRVIDILKEQGALEFNKKRYISRVVKYNSSLLGR